MLTPQECWWPAEMAAHVMPDGTVVLPLVLEPQQWPAPSVLLTPQEWYQPAEMAAHVMPDGTVVRPLPLLPQQWPAPAVLTPQECQ